jgi:rhamnogalacturonan endolyase
MIAGPVEKRLLPILVNILLCSCSGNIIQTTVFSDGLQELDPMVVIPADSDNSAIYFQSGTGTAGQWSVATSLRYNGFKDAWQVRRHGERLVLAQTFTNLDQNNEPLSLITHPIIVAGDSLWNDFKIEVDFTPQAKFDKCGLVFGYQHPNEFYFFGTEGNTVILKHVQQSVTPLRPIEKILEYRPLVWTPGEEIRAVVTVRRNKISTILNDSIRMYVEGEVIRPGRIGLISDLPAEFSRVEVNLLKGEQRKLSRKKRQLDRKQELHLQGHPRMVRWKAYETSEFGTNQNIRLGDLNGDGNKDILFIRGNAEAGSPVWFITAMSLEGTILWQYGDRKTSASEAGEELPVQIHDLDGDGHREVIFVSKGWINVLQGSSGKLITRKEIPVVVDTRSLVFGDLLGTGRDNCMLLTDREHRLVVLNERLDLLWERELDGGSHPQVYDINGDGQDEVLIGYSVFDPEGNLLFNTGAFIGDRCNGVSVYELDDGNRTTPCIIYAAGDWGMMYVDFEGNILKQNIMGHVSYLTVADLDAEAPGLEVVSSNGWGSDGLIHISGASGKVLYNFMSISAVSRCLPVNWKGDGEEFFIVSADSISGGMFDSQGQLSVKFPSDGHPVTCYTVQDLTGDARDEVLVWDTHQLWIYTQDDNPRMGNTYNPDRIPPYNFSMHQMNLSLPGW